MKPGSTHATGHGGPVKGAAACPQTYPCRADPSQDVLELMANMDLNFGAADAPNSSAKENARPNQHTGAGKKSKWRKKLDRVAADEPAAAQGGKGVTNSNGPGGATTHHGHLEPFSFYGVVQSQPKAQGKKGKKKKLPKKGVVVEISSPPILPPEDYAAAANGSSPGSNDDHKKRGHKQATGGRKYPSRSKPKAKKGGKKSPGGSEGEEYATNAGGAAVLAALGQYPYAYPAAVNPDGYSSPVSSPSMEGQEGYQMPYDPHAYVGYGQPYYGAAPYPYVATTPEASQQQPGQQPPAASGLVMMPAGYYVPVFYGHQQQGQQNEEQQQYQPGAEYPPVHQYPVYYPVPGYAPYGTVPVEQPVGSNVDGTHSAPSTPLNVDAPAFNPKGFEG